MISGRNGHLFKEQPSLSQSYADKRIDSELFNAKEKIRQQENIILGLQNETKYLRAQFRKSDNFLGETEYIMDNNNQSVMIDLKSKLQASF